MAINVKIIAGPDQQSSNVSASGSIKHIITNQERDAFHLSDSQLKKAIGAYFGHAPGNAYLHSPTPWDDLYNSYKWPQVQMVLTVERAEILSMTSTPSIIKTQTFKNSSSHAGEFNVEIEETVENTTTSNWSTGGTLTIGQEFEYGIDFSGIEAKGTTSLSYSQSWGVGGSHSKSISVGSSSGVKVQLEPGESVIADLSASRGVMKVRLHYNATLIGRTAINYNPTYKGHHFWGLDIGAVMAKGGISNSMKSTEDIEIGYYSNASVELRDPVSNKVKAAFMMDDQPGYLAA